MIKKQEDEYSLPTNLISYFIVPLDYLRGDDFICMVADELSVPKNVVSEDIERILQPMREDVKCCIEFPYVDPIYRDTFYSYFSKKYTVGGRDCFRLSFFEGIVDENSFSDGTEMECLGYVVLRPTSRRILGYSFINPKLYKRHDFKCCLCSRTVSINGLLFKISGFPFCGQDSEAMSCSEVSLVTMMDYFSRRYSSYRQLLPSQITKILSKHSHERQFPSMGLSEEAIAHVLLKLGFGIRIYYLSNDEQEPNTYEPKEFMDLLKIYVYSGFPLIACTNDHAFLIIGIQNNALSTPKPKFVINDDNDYPYKLEYISKDVCSFMVPLSGKTFLDAENLHPWAILKILNEQLSLGYDIEAWKDDYHIHTYLTTSRSFKYHVRNIKIPHADLFVSIAMPKFIWITEFIRKDIIAVNDNKPEVDSLLIYDATEGNSSTNNFITGRIGDNFIYRKEDSTQYRRKHYVSVKGVDDKILTFDRNLKGDHNLWQE